MDPLTVVVGFLMIGVFAIGYLAGWEHGIREVTEKVMKLFPENGDEQ
jgi:hypothetical protein